MNLLSSNGFPEATRPEADAAILARTTGLTSSQPMSAPLELGRTMVAHAARLARLAPDANEQEQLRIELGQILGYFRRLEQLDTDGVAPDYHPHEPDARMRPDSTVASVDRNELLASATKTKDGCLMVPRTVE